MSCDNQGVVGRVSNISAPIIIKGSDAFIETQLVYKGTDDSAASVGFSGATGFFSNDDGTVQAIPGVISTKDLSRLTFDLAASGTALLKAGEELSFEIAVEDDLGLRFFQFDGGLSINDRLY